MSLISINRSLLKVTNFISKNPVRSTLSIALGHVLLSWVYAICSQIIIPLPFNLVPMTIQPAPLLLASFAFGWHAVSAYALYLLQGACGLPFFSGMQGGLLRLLGPTGGYLLGFGVAMAFIAYGRHFFTRSKITLLASLFIAEVISFACGLFQLAWFVPADNLLGSGLYPFLISDFVIKIIFVMACLQLRTKIHFLNKLFIIGFITASISCFQLGAMEHTNRSAQLQLNRACIHGNIEEVLQIIRNEQNPCKILRFQNMIGLTALHCAIAKNHTDIIRAVISWAEETENVPMLLELRDSSKETLLHYAMRWNRAEIVKQLIACAYRHGLGEKILDAENSYRQTAGDVPSDLHILNLLPPPSLPPHLLVDEPLSDKWGFY